VWQLQQDGQLARFTSLGRFPAGVHCLAAAAAQPWLLTASLDGFVVAWSTDSWQQLYRCFAALQLSQLTNSAWACEPNQGNTMSVEAGVLAGVVDAVPVQQKFWTQKAFLTAIVG
jgi:hypothetical protein